MKLLRTIRLDPSDTFVFEHAAEPGEWAVPGAFMFSNTDPPALEGKARAAFRAGFLGVTSFGWSTLAQVVQVGPEDRAALVDLLAQKLIEHFGAPGITEARAAAEDEVAFAASLCNHPPDTLIAVHRSHEEGGIREAFRTLRPRNGPKPLRAFSFVEVDDPDGEAQERIDLVGLAEDEVKRP